MSFIFFLSSFDLLTEAIIIVSNLINIVGFCCQSLQGVHENMNIESVSYYSLHRQKVVCYKFGLTIFHGEDYLRLD